MNFDRYGVVHGAVASGDIEMPSYIEDRSSSELFITGSLDSFVPVNSLARLLWGALEGLCFDGFDSAYKNDATGRPAVDPRRLVGVWVLGLVRGITASTALARLCSRDVEFRWMLGDAPVQKSTLNAFRTAHVDALNEVCTQVLSALAKSDLLPAESLSIDGTVIRAASSLRAVRSRRKLERRVAELREVIAKKMDEGASDAEEEAVMAKLQARVQEALLEIKSLGTENHVTKTEPSAKLMKLKNGTFAPAYNVQVTADLSSGAIVSAKVIAQGNDAGQLLPQIENAQEALAKAGVTGKVKTVVADSAYHDTLQLNALESQGIACIVPEERANNRTPQGVSKDFRASAFPYDSHTNTMTCPAGQTLAYRRMNNEQTARVYQAKASACAICPRKQTCCPDTNNGRSVNRTAYPELLQAVRERVDSEHGKSFLRARWATAEGIFARLTERLGLRRMRAKETKGAQAELDYTTLAHNLMLLTGGWKTMTCPLGETA
jgi:transposase